MTLLTAREGYSAESARFEQRHLERAYALSQVRLYQVHDHFAADKEIRSSLSRHVLVYMLSGNASVEVDGERQPLPNRHFLWIRPGSHFRIGACVEHPGEAIRFVTVEVKPLSASGALAKVFHASSSCQGVRDTEGIDELLYELLKELHMQDTCMAVMLDSLLNRILVQTGRLLQGSSGTYQRNEMGNVKPSTKKELVYRAVQYIDQHIERMDELGQLAAVLDYSYSHLSHAFRAEMGIPLRIYWVQRRMNRAMFRLQSGRGSITQISEELRYQSVHAFSKAFKKSTGFTPSEYQSLYGKGCSHG